MSATVEGTFRIIDQASDRLKRIRENAEKTDKAMRSLGVAIDSVGSQKAQRTLDNTARKVDKVGDSTTRTAQKARVNMQQMDRAIEKAMNSSTARIEQVQAALATLDALTASPDIELEGSAQALAMIRVLKRELRTLETRQAEASLRNLSGAATDLAGAIGGGGGGGRFAGGVIGGLGGMAARLGAISLVIVALLPVIISFTGALSALIGSLGAATLGLGALAVAAGGAAVVGIGAMIAVIKPAITELGKVKKAQEDYTKAVQEYGAGSEQAAEAQDALNAAVKKYPGAARVIREMNAVTRNWSRLTRPARVRFFEMLERGLRTLRRMMRTFGFVANEVMSGVQRGWNILLRRLDRPEVRAIFRSLARTFAAASPIVARTFSNLALFFGRVARAASPVFLRTLRGIEGFTERLAGRARNRKATQDWIEKMVSHLRSWMRFLRSAVKLAGAFFGTGADPGQGMLDRMTRTMDRWTKQLQDPETQANVRAWFKDTIEDAIELTKAFGQIAKALAEIGDSLRGLIGPIGDVMGAFQQATPGDSPIMDLLIGYGLFRGAKGLRNRRRGGGRGPGGAPRPGGAPAPGGGGPGASRRWARVGRVVPGLGVGATLVAGGGDPIAGILGMLESEQPISQGQGFQRAVADIVNAPNRREARRLLRRRRGGIALGGGGRTSFDRNQQRQLGEAYQAAWNPQEPARGRSGRDARGARQTAQHLRAAARAGQAVARAFRSMDRAFNWRVEGQRIRSVARSLRSMVAATRAVRRGYRNLDRAFNWKLEAERIAKTGQIFRRLARTIQIHTQAARDNVTRNFMSMRKVAITQAREAAGSVTRLWGRMSSTMIRQNRDMLSNVRTTFRAIKSELVSNLRGMGFTAGEAASIAQGKDPKPGGGAPPTPGTTAARGARIPGVGLADTVPVAPGARAAPGELIVNRHTEDRVNRKLRAFGTSLGSEVAGERRPHSASKTVGCRHELGGYVFQRGGVVPLGRQLQGQGYLVGEHPAFGGVAPVHAPNSYHDSGMAIDVNWPNVAEEPRRLDALHSRLRGMEGVVELLWRVAGHFDHLHVAMGGGGGRLDLAGLVGGVAAPQMRKRKVRGPGSGRRAMAQAAIDALTGGSQGVLDQQGGGGALDMNVSGSNQQMGRQMMMQMWDASQWGALKELWTRESGWREFARNPSSGAYGIPQSLPASKMGPEAQGRGPAAARAQIAWGLRYIRERYGTPSGALSFHNAHNWYEQGGRVPDWGGWMAEGGRFTVHRPTLFGAGEAGTETVTVRPRGKGRAGGGRRITVSIANINYHGEGDIAEAVKREFERLDLELDTLGLEDEEDVLT